MYLKKNYSSENVKITGELDSLYTVHILEGLNSKELMNVELTPLNVV